MARSRRGVDNLVIKDGKVERETEPDGVSRLHFGLSNVERLLVGLLRVLHDGWGQASTLIRQAYTAARGAVSSSSSSCQPAQPKILMLI